MSLIEWLQDWVEQRCDGNWEHDTGIRIGTIDNPGWSVEINFGGTELSNKHFEAVLINRTENDWIDCSVSNNLFTGVGGVGNLMEVIAVFKGWTES